MNIFDDSNLTHVEKYSEIIPIKANFTGEMDQNKSTENTSDRGRQTDRTFGPSLRNISNCRSLTPATRIVNGLSDTKLSTLQAFFHTVKCNLGTGVLSMPSSFKNAGLLIGTLGTFIVAWVVVHVMHLLIECTQFIRSYNSEFNTEEYDLNYPETMDRVLRLSSNIYKKLWWLTNVLKVCLISAQVGFLSVYIVFVSQNMQLFTAYFAPDSTPPSIVFNVLTIVLATPLCFIKTIKKLTGLNVIANLLGFLCFAIVLVCCFSDLKPVEDFPLIKGIDTVPIFFGTIIFSFESINLILPIENKMRDQKAYGGSFGVLTVASAIVISVDVAIGFYGYLRFGEDVEGSITYSLPDNQWYYLMVKPLYSLSVLITFALHFYVLVIVCWEKIESRLYTPKMLFWGDVILRCCILLISFVLATSVPHVDLMISLVGATTGALLSIIFPSIMHCIIVWVDRPCRPYYRITIIKNVFMIVMGLFGSILGTYVTILSIIEVFEKDYH